MTEKKGNMRRISVELEDSLKTIQKELGLRTFAETTRFVAPIIKDFTIDFKLFIDQKKDDKKQKR